VAPNLQRTLVARCCRGIGRCQSRYEVGALNYGQLRLLLDRVLPVSAILGFE
jgi:hypothetical protein